MRLEKEQVASYGPEIAELYKKWLSESPVNGLTYFGTFSEAGELMAVASVKNYMGSWYLRGCVVKPEYRGKGLQRALIQERLNYLKDKTDVVRVSVYPQNLHSITNIEKSGFSFERKKKLGDGHEVLVYKFTF